MSPGESRQSPIDADLLGHDPELASTVESLRRPHGEGLDAGRASFGMDEAVPSSRRPECPVDSPADPPVVPSAFLLRTLPLRGVLRGHLPWRAVCFLAAACIIGTSAVAWGMVFLLRPSAFAKRSSEPRGVTARDEPSMTASARVLPTSKAVSSSDEILGPRGSPAPSPSPVSPVSRSAGARESRGVASVHGEILPNPVKRRPPSASETAPTTLEEAPEAPSAPVAPARRKAWFE